MDKNSFISNINTNGVDVCSIVDIIYNYLILELDTNHIIINRSIGCYSYIINYSFIFSIDIELIVSHNYDAIYDILDESLTRYKIEDMLEYF